MAEAAEAVSNLILDSGGHFRECLDDYIEEQDDRPPTDREIKWFMEEILRWENKLEERIERLKF